MALAGTAGIAGLAADTDGTDGGVGQPDDPAGALVDASTLLRAASSASIRPTFSMTTIRPNSLPSSATPEAGADLHQRQ